MVDYKWVESVPVKPLSNRALVLVSRFARTLKQLNGNVLSRQDPQLTKKMVAEVNSNNDPRLKPIFKELLLEFHGLVEQGDRGTSEAVYSSSALKKKVIYGGAQV